MREIFLLSSLSSLRGGLWSKGCQGGKHAINPRVRLGYRPTEVKAHPWRRIYQASKQLN